MKKIVIFSLATLFLVAATFISVSLYLSFKIVRPTTHQINKDLAAYLTRVVWIPQGIPRPIDDYKETIYSWEMETLAKEVTGINFKYTTVYSKNDQTLEATLVMPELGDPSIFDKVLPAVISDKQSLDSAIDPQKANLTANPTVGYKSIKLSVTPTSSQTIKIVWEFNKNELPENLKASYHKLENYPEPLLRFLYKLPGLALSLFKG